MSAEPAHFHAINKHRFDVCSDCALGTLRGARNGVITGVRVRLPYIFQAGAYALFFAEQGLWDRFRFVIKQMFFHGRNLAMFVGIYKAICCIFRKVHISGGRESLFAGFVGGFCAFGESSGISGSVNHQIVLYLFVRAVYALWQSRAKQWNLPAAFNPSTPLGFRVFAGIALALILYVTEYESESLAPSFMSTMNFLYYKSDSGPLIAHEDRNFWPVIALTCVSLLGVKYPKLSLENMLTRLFGDSSK